MSVEAILAGILAGMFVTFIGISFELARIRSAVERFVDACDENERKARGE